MGLMGMKYGFSVHFCIEQMLVGKTEG
jgi:hypothetical protein